MTQATLHGALKPVRVTTTRPSTHWPMAGSPARDSCPGVVLCRYGPAPWERGRQTHEEATTWQGVAPRPRATGCSYQMAAGWPSRALPGPPAQLLGSP